jgi:hypothetical protein
MHLLQGFHIHSFVTIDSKASLITITIDLFSMPSFDLTMKIINEKAQFDN